MRALVYLALAAATLPQAAAAADYADRYAAKAIAAEKYLEAEKRLLKRLSRDPSDPVALVNIARVYKATGRSDEARVTYARLLKLPNAALAGPNPNEPVWSHRIAQAALRSD